MSQSWCIFTPRTEMSMPPHQQIAEATPALRGPERSTQAPKTAAAEPRKMKKRVYIQVTSLTRQSQVVVVSASRSVMSLQTTDLVMPIERDSGSQKTL